MGTTFDSHHRVSKRSSRLITLVLLALTAGCGPVQTDEVSHSGATTDARDAAANPLEIGNSLAAEAVGSAQSPPGQETSSTQAEPLVVPAWMAKALASSDVQVKIQALDRWTQAAPVGSVDPLLLALENEDKTVRTTALLLLEQDWRRTQEDER